MSSRDPRTTERAKLAFEAARPSEPITRQEMETSVGALALAFRQACGNLGLTYSEALNRISAAWGPGARAIGTLPPPEPDPGFVRREAHPVADECTRPPPHQCGISGPCNGYPRKSNPSSPPPA